MSSLYELTGQFLQLQDMLEEETDPEYIQTILDTFEGLEFEIERKADGYARIMKNLAADVDGLKKEIDRLTNRKQSVERNIDALKRRLQESMEATGKEKFKTDLFSFGIQNNPASVVIDEQYIENIPEQFLIEQEPKIDRKAIKAAIQNGENLDGIAHLEQTRSLRIR